MLPKTHTIFGFLFALILALIFPKQIGLLGFFVIWVSSVLIDIDHYLLYVVYKKDLSFKRAVSFFYEKAKAFKKLPTSEQKLVHTGLYFLHGIEMIMILLALFFLLKIIIFFYIFLGFAFHMLIDLINIHQRKLPFYRISFFYSIYAQRNKKILEEIC